jgi:hypothetical protein
VDNWGRFVFLPHQELQDEVTNLLGGTLKIGNVRSELPLTRMNNLVTTFGVDRHRFVDTFKAINSNVPGSMRMLQGGEEEQRQTMSTAPNAYMLPIIERGKAIFDEKAGKLLVPDRIWMETAHVTAMLSSEPVLSNLFYSARLKKESLDRMKAVCLWLNTTWGILTTLASREETRGGFVSLKMSQWRLLPVLDIDTLSQDKITALASIFDNFQRKDLGRIPEQYGGGGRQLRTQLDLAFLKVMGIEAKESDLFALYDDISSSLRQWLGE